MSIRTKQQSNVANLIMMRYLQGGAVPTTNTVLTQLAQAFIKRQPGTPQTIFTPFIDYSVIDPVVFNKLVDDIQLDIFTAYQEAIDQVNRVARNFDYKETFRKRIGVRIEKLAELAANTQSNIQYSISNLLYSLEKINTLVTDAYIDSDTYTAKLPSISSKVTRASLAEASIDYAVSNGQTTVISDISNLISQAENSGFYISVASQQTSNQSTQQPPIVTITVTFPTARLISNIDLEMEISNGISIECQVDGQTLPSQTSEYVNTVKWNFSAINATEIVFQLTKNVPDSTSGSFKIYDFGIRYILFYYDEYISSATLQTLNLTFPTLLGSLTLQEQTITPKNTKVEWSFSVDNGNTFSPISPNKPTNSITKFTQVQKRAYPVITTRSASKVYDIDPSTSNVLSHDDVNMPVLSYWRGNTAPLFNICRLPNNYIDTSVSVRRGLNSWKVQSYHFTVPHDHNSPPPRLKDALHPRGGAHIKTRYQPMEWDMVTQYPNLTNERYKALRLPAYEYPLDKANDRTMHIFSARITTSPNVTPAQLKSLKNTVIPVSLMFANNRATIYLNDKKVPISTNLTTGLAGLPTSLTSTVSLPIAKGDNYILIITDNYSTLHGQPFTFGDELFSSLCAPGGPLIWYAENTALTKVSVFELQYQTDRNDYTRYAIADDTLSDSEIVLVRELPCTTYDVFYKVTDVPQKPSSVVVKAELHGDPSDLTVTPVISDFTLLNNW